ncbi:MAG: methyltransferase [Actinomycetota bacterium]|jgi:release factor glutamine methyltransferase
MSVTRDLVLAQAAHLAAAGIETPENDAELLLCHILGKKRSELTLVDHITEDQRRAFERAIATRTKRIPLQHITGRAPFRHIEVSCGPGVLTPRPETELLVDAAIKHTANIENPIIIDLCAGSAAMTISIAMEIKNAEVVGLELVPKAFEWGRKNVEEHLESIRRAGSKLAWVKGDVRGCERRTLSHYKGNTDVIVSNPPYIPNWAIPRDPEVATHEPLEALYGGDDGLYFVHAVLQAAKPLLKLGGMVIIEHGDLQGEDSEASVPRTVREAGGFTDVKDHLDLAGRPRFTTAIRAAE